MSLNKKDLILIENICSLLSGIDLDNRALCLRAVQNSICNDYLKENSRMCSGCPIAEVCRGIYTNYERLIWQLENEENKNETN